MGIVSVSSGQAMQTPRERWICSPASLMVIGLRVTGLRHLHSCKDILEIIIL